MAPDTTARARRAGGGGAVRARERTREAPPELRDARHVVPTSATTTPPGDSRLRNSRRRAASQPARATSRGFETRPGALAKDAGEPPRPSPRHRRPRAARPLARPAPPARVLDRPERRSAGSTTMAGPKKITPYLLFSTESREKAKQQLIDAGDPKPGMGDIAKTVGVMWHALGDDGKEVRRDFPANAPRRRERAPGPSPRDLVEIQNPSRLRLLERPAPRRRHPTKRPRTNPHRTFTPPLWFPQAYKTRAEEENAKAAAAYAAAVESGEVDEDADAENADRDANEPDVALPLARVKRIMKLDKEVKNCANDACRTITRATELFVESWSRRVRVDARAERKTIKHGDVEHHVLQPGSSSSATTCASRPRGETQAAASLARAARRRRTRRTRRARTGRRGARGDRHPAEERARGARGREASHGLSRAERGRSRRGQRRVPRARERTPRRSEEEKKTHAGTLRTLPERRERERTNERTRGETTEGSVRAARSGRYSCVFRTSVPRLRETFHQNQSHSSRTPLTMIYTASKRRFLSHGSSS